MATYLGVLGIRNGLEFLAQKFKQKYLEIAKKNIEEIEHPLVSGGLCTVGGVYLASGEYLYGSFFVAGGAVPGSFYIWEKVVKMKRQRELEKTLEKSITLVDRPENQADRER